ncbi:thiamine pyrophosphate-binding protein [Nostoc sp. DSM 114167]|jgi:N2-(2-carboxyethyl)arginine synthase|uniref:thiamine pyrophosphate-binding protein n=1 Tax=Nostoc sp. DSM 114167 TaxID=3439050 RepID=UPI0040463281
MKRPIKVLCSQIHTPEADISGAKLLLDTLSEHGISYIFAVPGREAESILFNESPNLHIVLTAIELTAGFAAYAYAIISHKTQVVFSTLGPGAANLANAIYSAYADRVAIVFITAQVEREKCYYNHTHQCMDAVKMYEPISKFAYEIGDVTEIRDVIENAFEITQKEPKGPAIISIPIDVIKQRISYKISPSKLAIKKINQSNLDIDSIDKVVSVLQNAKQPLVYVGNQVIRSGCVELIRRLCENYNLPMVSAYDAKGVLPTNHELNYFACTSYAQGILGINADEIIFSPVDCVIAFGYDWKDDVFPDKHFSYGIEKILIGFSSVMPEKIRSQFLDIPGNLEENLITLLHKLDKQNLSFRKPYNITLLKEAIKKKQANLEAPQGLINIISVINAINETSALLISDVGTFRHYAVLFSNTEKPNFFLTSAGSSSFGTGLPLGLGTCLACRNHETKIIVLTGDGGFNSIIGDLRTLKNLDLSIVIIVLNNNKNGLINIYQQKGHGQTYSPSVNHAEASFVKIAEGYNCKAFKVDSNEELKNSIKKAFEIGGPVVIEVPIYYPEEDIERLTCSADLA